jgi:hypothetical protein
MIKITFSVPATIASYGTSGRTETKIDVESSIKLHAAIKDDFEASAEPTKHPIEDGSPITDHVIVRPEKLTIEGIVSDWQFTSTYATGWNQTGGEKGAFSGVAVSTFSRLRTLLKDKTLLTLETPRGLFPDLVMTSLSMPREASMKDACHFTASFEKVIKVATATVRIEQKKGAVGPQQQGKVTPDKVSTEEGDGVKYSLLGAAAEQISPKPKTGVSKYGLPQKKVSEMVASNGCVFVLPNGDQQADYYQFICALDQSDYALTFRWSDRGSAWYMDITDTAGDLLLSGVRLSLGVGLLSRFSDYRLPAGEFITLDTSGQGVEAGRQDLGSRVRLYYVENEDLVALGMVDRA